MASSEHESSCGKDHTDTTENPVMRSDEMYGITTDMILKHKEMLTDILQDTKYGILEKLLASGGLTRRESTSIECSKNPYKRSRRLIEEVLQKNILPHFISALVDTGQMHLVNYLRGDGVRDVEFGDDWPLTRDRIKQLEKNEENLIDIIDPCTSGLIYTLFREKVINKRQLNSISEESSSIGQNKALLDIIRRQSVKDYGRTIFCLTESKQPRIVQILQGSGVICRIHVSQEGDPEIVNETEVAFSDRFADSLRGLSIEEVQRILEMTHLKFIAAQKTKSIYLYIYCATLQELMVFHNLLVTGDMKTIVETLFNKLVSRQDPIVVSYTYSDEEFYKCKSYFEEMESTPPEIQVAKVGYNTTDRPNIEEPKFPEAALMDTEIQKLRESKADAFRVNLERHRLLVEERMDPDHGLVDRLQETDAIDYNQVQMICSLKVPIEKSRKIIDIILERNAWEKIEKFCEALRETKQQHLLNYVEANGVYKNQFAGNWPLSDREIFIIDKKARHLKQKMDTDSGLLANLRKHKIITQSQEERVSQRPSGYERNAALLEIIRRGSLSEYKSTIDALLETKQGHVAKILIEAGTAAQIHSKATAKGDQPINDEDEAELLRLLQGMTRKDIVQLFEDLGLQQEKLKLHDAPVSEIAALLLPALFEFLRNRRTSKNRREITEGGEQEMPSIGPGTDQSPHGISSVPETTERSELEMPSIGPGTDQSPHGISSVPGMAEGGKEEMLGIGSGTAHRSSFPGYVVRVHNILDGGTEEAAENEIVTRIHNILSGMNLEQSNRVLERLQLTLFAKRVGH